MLLTSLLLLINNMVIILIFFFLARSLCTNKIANLHLTEAYKLCVNKLRCYECKKALTTIRILGQLGAYVNKISRKINNTHGNNLFWFCSTLEL